MFGRRRRVQKIAAGAARHLEAGENVHEVVQTQTGASALETAAAGARAFEGIPTNTSHMRPHAVVATDRNLYAMTLEGARLLDVVEVTLKVPLTEADVSLERDRLVAQGRTFHVMALFGKRATSLVSYVEQAKARTA